MKKSIKNIKKFLLRLITLSKRQQLVAVTAILTLSLIATQLFVESLRIDVLLVLAGLTYLLSAYVLREELRGWDFVTLLILPSFYTAAVFLFYFLLPTRWLTRLPIAALYAVGMYAILLTENIFNVATERNIQLIRAAHSVGFLLTLVTVFFLIDTVFSLRLNFYYNVGLTILIILPLALQAFWQVELTQNISSTVLISAVVVTLIISQLTLVFSFWPIKSTIEALFITTVFYSLVGMMQQYIIGRLFRKTTREFLVVLILVFVLVITTTSWG